VFESLLWLLWWGEGHEMVFWCHSYGNVLTVWGLAGQEVRLCFQACKSWQCSCYEWRKVSFRKTKHFKRLKKKKTYRKPGFSSIIFSYSLERKIIVITDWFAWSRHKLHLIERRSVQENKGYIVDLQARRVTQRSGGLSDTWLIIKVRKNPEQHLHLFDTTELKLLLFDSVKASSPTYECSLFRVDISYNIELRKVISVVLLLQAHTNVSIQIHIPLPTNCFGCWQSK